MRVHMNKEIDKLKKKMSSLCAYAEESLRNAVKSITDRDEKLAEAVIEKDYDIDQMEVDLEEDCLKILALYQPVATDLRFLITALKINNDIERIGDLAVNIAERGKFLATHPPVTISLDFIEMADITQMMLKESLDAMVYLDCTRAHHVRLKDDSVDDMNRQMYVAVQQGIRENPDELESLIHLLSVSRHLERIADHATNIAEDVIYMIEGTIVRHKPENYND